MTDPIPASGGATWLLDVDDTLLDTAAAMRAAAPDAVAELDDRLDEETAARIGRVYSDDPEDVFARYAAGEMTLEESRGQRLLCAYARSGIEPPRAADAPAAWGARFEDAFSTLLLQHLRVFPDVEPALARALSSGVRVGLVTNASEALTRRKLRATSLGTFPFVCVVTRDTLGFGKPDARVFEHAARLVAPELPRGDVVYVGDALEVDARAAARAGLRGVLLARNGTATPPLDVPTITTLGELLRA